MRNSTLTVEIPGVAAALPAAGVAVDNSPADTQESRATISPRSTPGTNNVRAWAILAFLVALVACWMGGRCQQQAIDDSRAAREAAATERLRNADALWNCLMEQQAAQRELERTKKDGSYFDERIKMYQSMHGRLLQEYQHKAINGSESQRMLETLRTYRQRIDALQMEKAQWQH